MKKFETPVVEIEKFQLLDVITTSGCEEYDPDCPVDTGR